MSEHVSAMPGASFEGFVSVTEAGLRGMISLRGDLTNAKLKTAVGKLAGVEVPGQGGINLNGTKGVAWMSPDELLILLPHGRAAAAVKSLNRALKGQHALVLDVSDARALFRIKGEKVREALAKLTPADMSKSGFAKGQIRRSRLAQVVGAFWMLDDQVIDIVCFRSVAGYMFELLSNAAAPGGEVDFF